MIEVRELNQSKELYFKNRKENDRLILYVDDNGKLKGMLSFFITEDLNRFKRNNIWSIPDENINGKYIYLDRLVMYRVDKAIPLFRETIMFLKNRFPNKKIVWHSRRGRKLCIK